MQPCKLYPQDFADYINSPLPPLRAYQSLLHKCSGKNLNDLFDAATKIISEEDSVIDLERIRAGLVYLEDKVSLIARSESFWVERTVVRLVPNLWVTDRASSALEKLKKLTNTVNSKIIDLVDSHYKERIRLSDKIKWYIAETKASRLEEHPEMKVLLADPAFCRASLLAVSRHAHTGKRSKEKMVQALVIDFRRLISDYGCLIGSRLKGLDKPFLSGDGELDLIESVFYASESCLHDLVIRLRSFPVEENLELEGVDQFYFMNICNALSLLTGEELP